MNVKVSSSDNVPYPPPVRMADKAPIPARHYVKCIDAKNSAGYLVEGRIYEVAIELQRGVDWTGEEVKGFILGHATTPYSAGGDNPKGDERWITWPFVFAPERFIEVPADEVKTEVNGRLVNFTRVKAKPKVDPVPEPDNTEPEPVYASA